LDEQQPENAFSAEIIGKNPSKAPAKAAPIEIEDDEAEFSRMVDAEADSSLSSSAKKGKAEPEAIAKADADKAKALESERKAKAEAEAKAKADADKAKASESAQASSKNPSKAPAKAAPIEVEDEETEFADNADESNEDSGSEFADNSHQSNQDSGSHSGSLLRSSATGAASHTPSRSAHLAPSKSDNPPNDGVKSPITGLPHKSATPKDPAGKQPGHAADDRASAAHDSQLGEVDGGEGSEAEQEIREEMADLDKKMKQRESLDSSSSPGSASRGVSGSFVPATSSLIMITVFFAFVVCAFIGYRRWKASRASYSAVATDDGSATEMSVILDSDQVLRLAAARRPRSSAFVDAPSRSLQTSRKRPQNPRCD
jgi:hypothetical protein